MAAAFAGGLDQLIASGGAGRGGSGGGGGSHPTPLTRVFDSDVLTPLVREDATLAAALMPLLPPGQQTLEGLLDTVSTACGECGGAGEMCACWSQLSHAPAQLRSPQLRQALGTLTGAMDGTNAGSVYATFGLNPADGDAEMAAGDPVAALIAAVQAQVDRRRREAGGGGGGGGGSS